MKAKLEKILRKKFPKYTPDQIAAEVERRIPTPADPNAEPPMDINALAAEAEAETAAMVAATVDNIDDDCNGDPDAGEVDATIPSTDGVDDDCDIDPYEDETAAPTPDPAPEPIVLEEPKADEGDDLTKIKGIGKKLQVKLSELGITTFQEVADLSEADIEVIKEQLDFKGRIAFEDWITQAAELAN